MKIRVPLCVKKKWQEVAHDDNNNNNRCETIDPSPFHTFLHDAITECVGSFTTVVFSPRHTSYHTKSHKCTIRTAATPMHLSDEPIKIASLSCISSSGEACR